MPDIDLDALDRRLRHNFSLAETSEDRDLWIDLIKRLAVLRALRAVREDLIALKFAPKTAMSKDISGISCEDDTEDFS